MLFSQWETDDPGLWPWCGCGLVITSGCSSKQVFMISQHCAALLWMWMIAWWQGVDVGIQMCVCVWTFECVSLRVIGVCLHAHICESGHLYACLRFMLICPLAPTRGNWHYHYWHRVISGQNTGAKAKCLLCYESQVRIPFSHTHHHNMTKLHYWTPWSQNAAAGAAVTVQMSARQYDLQVWGNSCTHYLLTQKLGKLPGFLAKDH